MRGRITHRSQLLGDRKQWIFRSRIVAAGALVLLAYVAGCSSSVEGAGSTTLSTKVGGNSSSSSPQTPGGSGAGPSSRGSLYDAIIYLCSPHDHSPACPHRTTEPETAAIEAMLAADSHVKSVQYRSEAVMFELAKQWVAPEVIKYLELGDYPATFLVALTDPETDYRDLASSYSKITGVKFVSNCSGATPTGSRSIDISCRSHK